MFCYNYSVMNLILTLLTFFNFVALLYLAFIVYKRNSKQNKGLDSNLTPSDIDLTPLKTSIQKIHLHRFNPFDELGGQQSFILTLLDQTNSGIIITSLHNREFTRLYAKSIKDGQALNTTLSKEEKNAILKTIKVN